MYIDKLTKKHLSPIPPLSSFLGRVGVAVIASHVYAVGGYDGVSNLNSVEVYNLERGAWSTTVSMTRHQGGVGVAVLPLSSMD